MSTIMFGYTAIQRRDIYGGSISLSLHELIIEIFQKLSSLQLSLQCRHNGRDSVSNNQSRDCFLSRLFRHRSKKTSKLRVTGLCVGNSPEAGEFPAQMASYAENVSI